MIFLNANRFLSVSEEWERRYYINLRSSENRNRKRKRASTSSNGSAATAQVREDKARRAPKTPCEQTLRTVYVKRVGYNLAKSLELASVRSFTRAVTEAAGPTENINCRGDSVRIVRKSELQKQTPIGLSQIDGKKVSVSLQYKSLLLLLNFAF